MNIHTQRAVYTQWALRYRYTRTPGQLVCPERDHCNHGSCQRGQFSSYASENIPCSDFTQLETDSDNNGAFKKTAESRDLQSFTDVSHRCNEAPCTHINIHTHAHTHTHTHTHTRTYVHTWWFTRTAWALRMSSLLLPPGTAMARGSELAWLKWTWGSPCNLACAWSEDRRACTWLLPAV